MIHWLRTTHPTPDDFARTITIRGELHTVVEALDRQLTHYAYHIGQIVLLAKHFRSAEWKIVERPKEPFSRVQSLSGTKRKTNEKKGLAAGMEFAENLGSNKMIPRQFTG